MNYEQIIEQALKNLEYAINFIAEGDVEGKLEHATQESYKALKILALETQNAQLLGDVLGDVDEAFARGHLHHSTLEDKVIGA